MKNTQETKEERTERQLKQHKQMIKELKESVASMFTRKVQRDAYYIDYKGIVEQCV